MYIYIYIYIYIYYTTITITYYTTITITVFGRPLAALRARARRCPRRTGTRSTLWTLSIVYIL